uniref:Uncharacterized protein n=1 Tax=Arundo donax TaxID=35708 RepID=A0A0A8YAR3_ARUDO
MPPPQHERGSNYTRTYYDMYKSGSMLY